MERALGGIIEASPAMSSPSVEQLPTTTRPGGEDDETTSEIYHLQEALEPYEQQVRIVCQSNNTQQPFYPFLREQLEFYEEAVRQPLSIDHSIWMSHIAEDTLALLYRAIQISPEEFNCDGEDGGKRKRQKRVAKERATLTNTMINADDREALAMKMMDNAVKCGAYTSTVSMLMRYGKMNRTDACKFLIGTYAKDRAGAFVWTRLAVTPALNVFLEKNFSRTDFVYLMLKTLFRGEISTQRMFELLCDVFEKVDVINAFARDVYVMKSTGSMVSYFNGRKMTIDRSGNLRKFVSKLDTVEIASSHVEIQCGYAYRTNYGIFSPLTGVFESNGPSLNELVYRELDASVAEQILYFKPELFHFGLNCFLKVPAYIRHVESTVPVMLLVSPLWPVYNKYHDFGRYQTTPIRDFVLSDFQTLLADLNLATRYPWPEDLCAQVAAIAHTELGVLIVNCLGALYTLAKYVTIDPLNVVQIIISLFGDNSHSYIGIPQWEMEDEHKVIIKAEASSSSRQCQGITSPCQTEETSGGSDVGCINETNTIPLAVSLTFKSPDAQSSVDMTELFRKIGFCLASDCDTRVDLNRYDYVQCAILIAAWFVRMGEMHVLNESPLFVYINAERPKLYAQLVQFARGMASVSEAKDHQELTDHFLAFVERTECDPRDEIRYPETFNVNALRRLHAENKCYARLIGNVSALTAPPSDHEKQSIASAVVHLLRSGSFQYDYFVEFCKIIANLEYLSNRLQLGYNFYGKSSSGRSFFVQLLDRVFASGPNTILSSQKYHDNNAILLATNFLVQLNKDELKVDMFNKYVNYNYVSTWNMLNNLSTKYPIRAKVFFITNHYVQVNKPCDRKFYNKYYPLSFDWDFVSLHERLDRLMEHRSALKLYTTKYLGGQILMQRYPDGSIGQLDKQVTVLSRQFLTRFFFHDVLKPVTEKKTRLIERLYYRYFHKTSPIQYFYDTVEIVPSDRSLDESSVREILFNWWKKHKCNFHRIKQFENIAETIINQLKQYRFGNNYNIEFVMKK